MTITLHVTDARGYRATTDLAGLDALLREPGTTVWIDSDERSTTCDDILGSKLKLHPLVIEDIYSDRVTPKVEDYGDFLYVVMHGVQYVREQEAPMTSVELDVVIGPNWVFTHHATPMTITHEFEEELARNPRTMARGPAYVAHAIIDRLTDYYVPVVDAIDEDIDELQQQVVERPDPELLSRIFTFKRSMQRLRRIAVYQREILQRLSRGEFEQIPEPALPFYRDVYDHFVRIADLADSYRELLGSALEVYMSVTANRTNEIMRVLAIISTVMLPLTFIAGVYGMNFKHMPELGWHLGYPFALALMASVAIAFLLWFRSRGWIGTGASARLHGPRRATPHEAAPRTSVLPPHAVGDATGSGVVK